MSFRRSKDSVIPPPLLYLISFITLYPPLVFPLDHPRELKTYTLPLCPISQTMN